MSQDGFATRAIHVGQEPDPTTGAVIVPIYQTSTYAQSEVGVHKGYDYSRTANPTRAALEACLASLDNGRFGLAFASGMAAEDTLLHLLDTGDHVVVDREEPIGMITKLDLLEFVAQHNRRRHSHR